MGNCSNGLPPVMTADEPAFDALVERHGPMVLRVCRRLLDDPNDAEDAFQATFLVLLRQARSIRRTGSLAAWLHGVAAAGRSRARVESARRRRIERHAIEQAAERNDDPDRLDLETLFDVELARLPGNTANRSSSATSRSSPTKAPPTAWAGRSAPCGADWRGREISSARD